MTELLLLIARLDDMLYDAKPVPLTNQVRLDKQSVRDVLDQMRAELALAMPQARPGEAATGGGLDRQALREAVSDAVRACIPEIAAAAAAATSARSGPSPPPGGPF